MTREEIRLNALQLAYRVAGDASIPALLAAARKFTNFIEEKETDEDLKEQAEEEAARAVHDDVVGQLKRMDQAIKSDAKPWIPPKNLTEAAKKFYSNFPDDAKVGLPTELLEDEDEQRARKLRQSLLATQMMVSSNFLEFCKYVKITHPILGEVNIKLFDYQEEMIRHILTNRLSIINHSRQIGITTLLTAYALWYAIAHDNSSVQFIVPKTSETMQRFAGVINGLPLDMRPKIKNMTRTEIKLGNESTVTIVDACNYRNQSLSPNLVVMDMTALFSHRCSQDVWSTLIPAVETTKIVMASTPNDTDGLFYHTWQNRPANGFAGLELPWDVHPERDEKWAALTKQALTGAQWQREFECKFIKR